MRQSDFDLIFAFGHNARETGGSFLLYDIYCLPEILGQYLEKSVAAVHNPKKRSKSANPDIQ